MEYKQEVKLLIHLLLVWMFRIIKPLILTSTKISDAKAVAVNEYQHQGSLYSLLRTRHVNKLQMQPLTEQHYMTISNNIVLICIIVFPLQNPVFVPLPRLSPLWGLPKMHLLLRVSGLGVAAVLMDLFTGYPRLWF